MVSITSHFNDIYHYIHHNTIDYYTHIPFNIYTIIYC